MTDPILTALQAKSWGYGDQDPVALAKLNHVIADVGRRGDLIHYSKVVHGITFRVPSVDGGAPFELGVPEWRDLGRAILGSSSAAFASTATLAVAFWRAHLLRARTPMNPVKVFGISSKKSGWFALGALKSV